MEEFNKLINGSKPVLVDFFATWCGPCRMQSPILDKVKSTVGDEADVLKIDVDQNKALAAKYTIKSVPTLIYSRTANPYGAHLVCIMPTTLYQNCAKTSDSN